MSEVRLYLDEDAESGSLVRGLRARGFDILTTFEAGRSGMDDESQLEFATAEGRSIYTFNVGDFARLHQQFCVTGQSHAGILTVPRQRYSIGEQIRRISGFLAETSAEGMVNRLAYL